jgi:phosphoribosylamine--glycine ligase
MLTSGGYPGPYEKDKEIMGLENTTDCLVFHAGTKKNTHNIVTNGGRVLSITGMGPDMESALENCYKNVDVINFDGKYFRKDIGFDLR